MKGSTGSNTGKAIIGIIVVLALIVAGAGYAVAAYRSAQHYDRSVDTAAEAKQELDKAIVAGQRVLGSYKADQLKDPELMTDFDQTLIQAKTLDAPNDEPNRWLLWKTDAARADNERYASDAKAMASLVKRSASEVKASVKAKQQSDSKQNGDKQSGDTAAGNDGQAEQSGKTETSDQAGASEENHCAAFSATYARYQAGSAVTVHDDCSITANGGGEPSVISEHAYVPRSFASNGDGTYSWQADEMDKTTYYPAGVHAPAFDEFHASAGTADPTLGTDRLVIGGSGNLMYVRND